MEGNIRIWDIFKNDTVSTEIFSSEMDYVWLFHSIIVHKIIKFAHCELQSIISSQVI